MAYAIEMLDITKDFPGIRANDHVTLRVKEKSIHALLGENGAGKSTLMSILFGLYQPTSGIIQVKGKKVSISDPNVANQLGIGMVHQHFKLVECFSVIENIILGLEPKGKWGTIDMKKAAEKVKEISTLYGLNVDPYARIRDISVGMQQRVEILKMLYRQADILIFDEPTAVLTPQEIQELMGIMRNLIKEGKTILLITHKLKEIKKVADVCTILRKGQCIGTIQVDQTSEAEMASMMVGRDVNFNVNKKTLQIGNEVLNIQNLCVKNTKGLMAVKNFSLSIRSKEIVGLAGIDGNGQSELIYALTGLCKAESGEVIVKGKNIMTMSIKKRHQWGLSHVPEDRHKHGLVLDFTLKENFILHCYDQAPFSKHTILQMKEIDHYANELIQQYDVRCTQGKDTIVRSMSGGNQQKAIMARELDQSNDLLLIVQPTRGLDVGAIETIHQRIIEKRDQGYAIFLISFELDEIMALSDRIAIIHDGELSGLVDQKNVDENEIGLMMAGALKRIEVI